jgi:hypothetical protein
MTGITTPAMTALLIVSFDERISDIVLGRTYRS